MRAKGYGSYRGRSPFKSFFRILAVIVVVLVILGVAAAVYLQQFLVISNDGVRLELPFFHHEEEIPEPVTTPPAASPEPPVVMVTPTPMPTPKPEPEALSPVLLPQEALYDGSALSQVETSGGDSALFDMKADSGKLSYVSAIELAQYTKQTADDTALNSAITVLNSTETLYTIARVSCFKDDDITDWERSLSIFTNSGYRWTDPEDIHWISPTNSDVRDYLTEICVELAQLGFDEILLDNAGYPSQGNLHYIKKGDAYDSTKFASVIDGFYAQVSSALADYDVKLSVVTTAEAMSGQDTLTGQTPAALDRFDRLWVRDETDILAPYEATARNP